MRTDCIVKLSKLQISELNTLVQKETSGDVEGNLLFRTRLLYSADRNRFPDLALCLFSPHGPPTRRLPCWS
jgi:hypothetical protein